MTEPEKAIIELKAAYPDRTLSGSIKSGEPDISALLARFADAEPFEDDSGAAIKVTRLDFIVDTDDKEYTLDIELSPLPSINIGITTLQFQTFAYKIAKYGGNTDLAIAATLDLGSSGASVFTLTADYREETAAIALVKNNEGQDEEIHPRAWYFTGTLDGTPTIAELITDAISNLVPEDAADNMGPLSKLTVKALAFSFDTSIYRRYSFSSIIESQEIALNKVLSLKLSGGFAIEGYSNYDAQYAQTVWRKISMFGEATLTIAGVPEFLDNLRLRLAYTQITRNPDRAQSATATALKPLSPKMKAVYNAPQNNNYVLGQGFEAKTLPDDLQGIVGSIITFEVELRAALTATAYLVLENATSITAKPRRKLLVQLESMTIGELLQFMASLVNPVYADLTFESPWDELMDIQLLGLELQVDLNTKIAIVSTPIAIDLGFMTISDVGFRYEPAPQPQATQVQQNVLKQNRNAASKKGKLTFQLWGNFLGTQYGQGTEASTTPTPQSGNQQSEPLGWDPTEEGAAPVVPSTAPKTLFDLSFLGIGQRVTIEPSDGDTGIRIGREMSTEGAITALQNAILDLEAPTGQSDYVLNYNREAGWLIAADFTVIEAVRLAFIFNDPFLYGLLVELGGDTVGKLAGLKFDILYRRITDHIGVYHTELTLPDAMRQLQFGAVAITLPIIVLDIYTNSDFRIDVGFPANNDFSRSAVVEAGIFIGSGGFYFAKLSGDTATMMPELVNGYWNPVIAFGLGLKLGIGRSFNKGPLAAELSLTVQGIFEGIFAWFNPTEQGLSKDTYYMLQASLHIVGRLYGVVDFVVIVVDVEVLITAGVRLRYIVYAPMVIQLEAGVSVRASVKVLFVKVEFSFAMTVKQTFTIGSQQPTPWILKDSQAVPVLAQAPIGGGGNIDIDPSSDPLDQEPILPLMKPTLFANQPAVKAELDWSPIALWSPQTIDIEELPPQTDEDEPQQKRHIERNFLRIHFQPALTQGLSSDNLSAQPDDTVMRDAKAVALLTIPYEQDLAHVPAVTVAIPPANPTAPDAEEQPAPEVTDHTHGFDTLAFAMLMWGLHASFDDIPTQITIDHLQVVYDKLTAPSSAGSARAAINIEQINAFLAANFIVQVTDVGQVSRDVTSVFFPMLPTLTMTYPIWDDVGRQIPVDLTFDQMTLLTPAQIQGILQQFAVTRKAQLHDRSNGAGAMALAELLYVDYFNALMRTIIDRTMDYYADYNEVNLSPLMLTAEQLRHNLATADVYSHVGGLVSRSLMSGLRFEYLEQGHSATGVADVEREQHFPLYTLTGQAFPVRVLPGDLPISISLTKPVSAGDWLQLVDKDTPDDKTYQSIQYQFSTALQEKIEQFATQHLLVETAIHGGWQQTDLNPSLELQELYQDTVPTLLILNRSTRWQVSDATYRVWSIKESLANELREVASIEANMPESVSGDPFMAYQLDVYSDEASLQNEQAADPTAYHLGTMVEFEIRRLNADGAQDMVMIVGTDDDGEAKLEYLYNKINEVIYKLDENNQRVLDEDATKAPKVDLHLSYLTQNNGIINYQSHDSPAYILRTNLATMVTGTASVDDAPFYASINDYTPSEADYNERVSDFVRLLWQASSLESDGYFLRLASANDAPALPDDVFTNGDTARLQLIAWESASSSQLRPHHNCIVFTPTEQSTASIDDAVIAVKFPYRTRTVQRVDAGNMLIRVLRQSPQIDEADRELENLYQLMAYNIFDAADGDGTGKNWLPSLPILPLVHDVAEHHPTHAYDWVYDRVIPSAMWWAWHKPTPADAVTSIDMNSPYYGIVLDDEQPANAITVDFDLRDIFGNETLVGDEDLGSEIDPLQPQTLPLTYTDDVIGVNQWPSLTETYHIVDRQLKIQMKLQVSAYAVTDETPYTQFREKVVTNADQYAKIASQLAQPDVTITLAHTLGKVTDTQDNTFTIPKQGLIAFVNSARDFLNNLRSLTPYQINLADAIASTPTPSLQQLADTYHIPKQAIVSDNGDQIGFAQAITLPFEFVLRQGDTALQTVVDTLRTAIDIVVVSPDQIALTYDFIDVMLNVFVPDASNAQPKAVQANTITVDNQTITLAANENWQSLIAAVAGVDDVATLSAEQKQAIEAQLLQQERLVRPNSVVYISLNYTPEADETLLQSITTINALIASTQRIQQLSRDQFVAIASVADAPLRSVDSAGMALQFGNILQSTRGQSSTVVEQLFDGDKVNLDAILANQNIKGLVTAGVRFGKIELDAFHTLQSIARESNLTVVQVARALKDAGAFATEAIIVTPPQRYAYPSAANTDHPTAITTTTLPADAIFPIVVMMTIARDERLIHLAFKDVASVQQASATFAPETGQFIREEAQYGLLDGDSNAISLSAFVETFEASFPNLKVAIGRDDQGQTVESDNAADPAAVRPLWAVQIYNQALPTTIAADNTAAIRVAMPDNPIPNYYSMPPLSTQLISGEVMVEGESRRFEAVDIDVWMREFLMSIDEALTPQILFNAYAYTGDGSDTTSATIDQLLTSKREIADMLSSRLETIFTGDIPDEKIQAARALFRQQLLIHLTNAYDVETVIQVDAQVNVDAAKLTHWQHTDETSGVYAPRLVAQPTLESDAADAKDRNFTISTAPLALESDGTTQDTVMTFLFNTKAPMDDEEVVLTVKLNVKEMEYDRKKISDSVADYIASRWLSFVNPLESQQFELRIPVPVRSYPMPPALINQHEALDRSSIRLHNVREWTYVNVYEHPTVAQDTIYVRLLSNEKDVLDREAGTSSHTNLTLFGDLAQFHAAYATVDSALASLKTQPTADESKQGIAALQTIASFAGRIAESLKAWSPSGSTTRITRFPYIAIEEVYDRSIAAQLPVGEGPIDVNMTVVGAETSATSACERSIVLMDTVSDSDEIKKDLFVHLRIPTHEIDTQFTQAQQTNTEAPPQTATRRTFYFKRAEAPSAPNLGASDLPDRELRVDNLDIIDQQNMTSEIWLMRNDQLGNQRDASGNIRRSNPEFIYRTPVLGYTSPVMPFLINETAWDIIDEIDGLNAGATLDTILQALMDTILPERPCKDYALQIGCQYGFDVFYNPDVAPSDGDDRLMTQIPVLLGLPIELSAVDDDDTQADNQSKLDTYRSEIVQRLVTWYGQTMPESSAASGASFIFQFRIFSRLDSTNPNLPLLQLDNLRVSIADVTMQLAAQ